MPRACVFFHAHPDDEALLTAGTMAQLAAHGLRVVLVVATAGEAGLAAGTVPSARLRQIRLAELAASARALGCARVHCLDYEDSGSTGKIEAHRLPFARVPVDAAAGRLAALLVEEDAGLVSSYDAAGGYGHPDHVQAHRVAARAARLAGTPVLLEATVPRGPLLAVLRAASVLGRLPSGVDVARFRSAYTPARAITHRVDVRPQLAAKRASMVAHASQAGGGPGERTLAALLQLPHPLFSWVCGTEWYVRSEPR